MSLHHGGVTAGAAVMYKDSTEMEPALPGAFDPR